MRITRTQVRTFYLDEQRLAKWAGAGVADEMVVAAVIESEIEEGVLPDFCGDAVPWGDDWDVDAEVQVECAVHAGEVVQNAWRYESPCGCWRGVFDRTLR